MNIFKKKENFLTEISAEELTEEEKEALEKQDDKRELIKDLIITAVIMLSLFGIVVFAINYY